MTGCGAGEENKLRAWAWVIVEDGSFQGYSVLSRKLAWGHDAVLTLEDTSRHEGKDHLYGMETLMLLHSLHVEVGWEWMGRAQAQPAREER